MRKVTLVASASALVLALVGAAPANAAPPETASCQGIAASFVGTTEEPGRVAFYTHLLQDIAEAQGVSMGTLNREIAQFQGTCF
jgi:hypothetical protein